MRQAVIIDFGRGQTLEIPLPAGAAMATDEARRWLDEQFTANECEPFRASGKVLTADKVLALAASVGRAAFETDADFRETFARAVVAALGSLVVHVDIDASTVRF